MSFAIILSYMEIKILIMNKSKSKRIDVQLTTWEFSRKKFKK